MAQMTAKNRRLALDQALASTRIEGHVPSASFVEDCERVADGRMTFEDARKAALARARVTESIASSRAAVKRIAVSPVKVRNAA